MGRKNKNMQVLFNPPTRYPVGINPANVAKFEKQLEAEINSIRTQTSNDTLNLLSSAFIIVLKEYFDFDKEKLQETMSRVFEQLDLCGSELVTIDQMMDLCESYGVDVHKDTAKMEELGRQMNVKIKVFELLDKGIIEIEDITKAAGITAREANGFRWLYNKFKYGKEYDAFMTKKEEAFKLLDQGATPKELMKKLGIPKASAYTYKYEWKKMNGTVTIDDLADEIFGPDSDEEDVKEENKGEAPVQEKTEEPNKQKKKGLTRKVSFEGEIATYTVNNKVCDIELDGQVIALGAEEIDTLIYELQEVRKDM